MSNPTCLTCRWWHSPESQAKACGDSEDAAEDYRGECHRNAPSPVNWAMYLIAQWKIDEKGPNHIEGMESHWPETSDIDFCGEHQPRPADGVAS